MKKWLCSSDKRTCLVGNCYVKLLLTFFYRVISNKGVAVAVNSPGAFYSTMLLYSTSEGGKLLVDKASSPLESLGVGEKTDRYMCTQTN